MDDLTYEPRQMCHRNRGGGHKTQAQRMQSLTLIARQLKEMGFRNMHASSLKEKHVDALLERWTAENLSAGTIKNQRDRGARADDHARFRSPPQSSEPYLVTLMPLPAPVR